MNFEIYTEGMLKTLQSRTQLFFRPNARIQIQIIHNAH